MAANVAAAAGEFERVAEISDRGPIPMLEPALRRVLSTSRGTGYEGGWASIGHKSVMDPQKNFK